MSDNQNPVAWHVTGDDYEYATLLEEHARAVVEEDGGTVAPLYRSPTITGAERTAMEGVIEDYEHDGEPASAGRVATLRGLLARLGDTFDTHATPSEGIEQNGCTITDKEREAVRFCFTAALPETEKLGGVAGELCRRHAATLRALLERLGGGA